jgi:hypothetical protein
METKQKETKTMELQFLGVDYSDYFRGHGGHIYVVPVDSETTWDTLKTYLQLQIEMEEVDGADDSDYSSIEESAAAMEFPQGLVNPEAGDDCYAYFGIV